MQDRRSEEKNNDNVQKEQPKKDEIMRARTAGGRKGRAGRQEGERERERHVVSLALKLT